MYSQPFDIFFKKILCKINETQVLFSNFYLTKRDAFEYVSKIHIPLSFSPWPKFL